MKADLPDTIRYGYRSQIFTVSKGIKSYFSKSIWKSKSLHRIELKSIYTDSCNRKVIDGSRYLDRISVCRLSAGYFDMVRIFLIFERIREAVGIAFVSVNR